MKKKEHENQENEGKKQQQHTKKNEQSQKHAEMKSKSKWAKSIERRIIPFFFLVLISSNEIWIHYDTLRRIFVRMRIANDFSQQNSFIHASIKFPSAMTWDYYKLKIRSHGETHSHNERWNEITAQLLIYQWMVVCILHQLPQFAMINNTKK